MALSIIRESYRSGDVNKRVAPNIFQMSICSLGQHHCCNVSVPMRSAQMQRRLQVHVIDNVRVSASHQELIRHRLWARNE